MLLQVSGQRLFCSSKRGAGAHRSFVGSHHISHLGTDSSNGGAVGAADARDELAGTVPHYVRTLRAVLFDKPSGCIPAYVVLKALDFVQLSAWQTSASFQRQLMLFVVCLAETQIFG